MVTVIVDETEGLSEEQQIEILRKQHLFESGETEAESWSEVKKRYIEAES
jgi:hypothetical protein